MSIQLPPEIDIGTLLPLPYSCVDARWTTEDSLNAIWGACDVGKQQREYVQNAFIFQHDTKTFRVTVDLPESGDSLADATEIIYRVYNPSGGATVFEKSLGAASITVVNATQFTFTLDNSETGVTPADYRHECRITANSEPATVLTGRFRVVDTNIGDV